MTDRPNPQRPCPTPAKVRHATKEAAERSAHDRPDALRVYECECSWWHLTSKLYVTPVASEAATAEVVALSDEDFAVLVSEEVQGKATAEQAGALREPVLVDRWLVALKQMQTELDLQFFRRRRDRSAALEPWRARALLVQSGIQDRMREARAIRAALVKDASARRVRSKVAVRARRRLIEAHQEEYEALLAEERARVVVSAGEVA